MGKEILLSLRDITKKFEEQAAVDQVSLEIKQGEIVCLLGPSGCGKTTLLRIIAGLESPDGGQVLLRGKDISPIPPHERDFGLMFQDFALFPHKNVFDNVVFGLRMGAKMKDPPKQAQRVQEVLNLVGMEDFTQRRVTDLSGGEKQRVALARSLAPRPRLLMLDEPLGSLDRAMRERLMFELRHILKQVGVTAIYVTHDQAEAFAIADQVVVMRAGRIEQIGPPETIYHHPQSIFVARFLGLSNLAEGKIIEPDRVDSLWGELAVNTSPYQVGDSVMVLIRPEAAQLIRNDPSNGKLALRGRLESRSFRGGRYQLRVQPEQGPLLTFELGMSGQIPLETGSRVTVLLESTGIVLLDKTLN